MHRWRAAGLTMIELMVALAISLLLIGASTPGLHAWAQNHRARVAAEQLAADLRDARMDAVQQSRALNVQLQSKCWSIGSAALACNCEQQACGTPGSRNGSLAEWPGLRIAQPQGFAFTAHGVLAPAKAQRLVIVNAEQPLWEVRLGASGQARVCRAGAAQGNAAACR
jgi:type IV fimbrial biogenesis protein FimT